MAPRVDASIVVVNAEPGPSTRVDLPSARGRGGEDEEVANVTRSVCERVCVDGVTPL
jgi:hypothetical protein